MDLFAEELLRPEIFRHHCVCASLEAGEQKVDDVNLGYGVFVAAFSAPVFIGFGVCDEVGQMKADVESL